MGKLYTINEQIGAVYNQDGSFVDYIPELYYD